VAVAVIPRYDGGDVDNQISASSVSSWWILQEGGKSWQEILAERDDLDKDSEQARYVQTAVRSLNLTL